MKITILKASGKCLKIFLFHAILFSFTSALISQGIIIDHNCIDISKVPDSWINQAKASYRISYGHTSHGSQIVSGMQVLMSKSSFYSFNSSGTGGALSLHDRIPSGDLGNPSRTEWYYRTRDLLDNPNKNRNFIMWSWCGQVSSASETDMDTYLSLMNQLEVDYPNVTFVYMTGHLDGTGEQGNLNTRNNQIRSYCRTYNKILFDFADIESYDPDGNYFLDKGANDGCYYWDNDTRKNWAEEWCSAHPGECSSCSCAHSKSLNCDMKGRAFWWMMARIAGWDGITNETPIIESDKTRLNFGLIAGGNNPDFQTIRISNKGVGSLNWTAYSPDDWINLTPQSGTQNGSVRASVDASGISEGTYSGSVLISDANASNSPLIVPVIFIVYASGSTNDPFGGFDSPVDGTTGVTGAIPVTGWVLDDVGIDSVKVYRDKMAGETAADATDLIYIGDAVFVEGARPDVEQAYSDYPLCSKAGWGYMMLTNFLPNQGNGSYTIYAMATDKEGHKVSLGTKTIHCDNANAIKPFGTIDTPTQGGEVYGNIWIAGWTLTPQPCTIPTDGSTIWIWIDGQKVGHPDYNQYRNDIATLFPGYANSGGAVGSYYLDTAQLANGVHTIAWSVRDDCGNSDGIGSRFFSVMNAGTSGTIQIINNEDLKFSPSTPERNGRLNLHPKPIRYRTGYSENKKFELAQGDEYGLAAIEIVALERVEILLGSGTELIGHLIVGDQLRPLPIGSTLDRKNGIFYWQPGPGFLGDYEFVFSRTEENGTLRRRIRIRINPKFNR